MGILRFLVTALLLMGVIGACAAMGVPATSDPARKLGDAYELIQYQGRPLPAERLIRESIVIYEKNNDEMGLAAAYRMNGIFFASAAVERLKKTYEGHGFLEKSASFETRYDKSIEFLNKAESIVLKHNDYNKLSNIYLNKGIAYEAAGKNENACKAYQTSLDNNRRYKAENPEAELMLPNGYENYDQYIVDNTKRLGCK